MRSRAILTLTASATLGLAAVAPALAHSPVVGRSPAPGSTASNVRAVKVRFGDTIITGLIEVRRGATVVKPASLGLKPSDHAVLQATFARPLGRGSYQVSWRARANDGHSESGSWRFTVR